MINNCCISIIRFVEIILFVNEFVYLSISVSQRILKRTFKIESLRSRCQS